MVTYLDAIFSEFMYHWPKEEPKPPASIRPLFSEQPEPSANRDAREVIGVEIQFAVAGFKEEDLNVYHEGRTIIVEGKNVHHEHIADKFKCSFERKISLKESLDLEKAEVSLEDGILAISLPIKDPDEDRTYLLGKKG